MGEFYSPLVDGRNHFAPAGRAKIIRPYINIHCIMFIQANDLWKTYTNSLGQTDREVLCGLDLEVAKGEKVAIMGPSGSGKTTLLNLLGTLDVADRGSITIGGRLISGLSPAEMLAFRNRSAGFVFQFHHLLPQCTLWENVLLPTLAAKGSQADASRHAEELLNYMGVWEQRNNKPGELSGGECQRAAVARALINRPELLLADEPTGSLDAENATLLVDLLTQINKDMGVTLVIATHAAEIAGRMDRRCQIRNGKLECTQS